MSAGREDAPGRGRAWEAAWAQRESLLKIARRRSPSRADAEDAVSEAITRSAETADVDHDRMGPWLTAVTTRLCIDEARERGREPQRIAYQVRQGMTTPDHEDDVCDRAEAGWLAGHLASLPARQSQALELRADGLEVTDIAKVMGISDKAAEGLLQRARVALREVLSSALGWFGLVIAAVVGVTRRRTAIAGTAVAAAGLSTVLAVVQLPSAPAEAGPERSPTAGVPASQAGSRDTDERRLAPPSPDAAPPVAAQPVAPPAAPVAVSEATRPVPSATPSPWRTVLPPKDVEIADGAVYHKGGGPEFRDTDEPFADAVQRCLREGPVVSQEFVGCRPSGEPRPGG